jgi:hypothetical protein
MLIVDLGAHCVGVGNMVDAPTSLTQSFQNIIATGFKQNIRTYGRCNVQLIIFLCFKVVK